MARSWASSGQPGEDRLIYSYLLIYLLISIQVRLANKLRLTTARVARYLPESVAKCPELEQVGTHFLYFSVLETCKNVRYMYIAYVYCIFASY